MDALGRMMVTTDGFRAMAGILQALADEACDGRLVALQEGGYNPEYVPYCTLAAVEGVMGRRSAIPDPYEGEPELARARVEHRPHQSAAIAEVVAVQRTWWRI